MNRSYSALKEKLPASAARRITEICGDFEDAWKRGERPQIESYLKDVAEPERTVLFCDLLLLELDYRKKNGEKPNIADYQDRFPEEPRIGEIIDAARTDNESASQDSATDPESTQQTISFGGKSMANVNPPFDIAGYEILDAGKRGGMGTVYKARNPRTEAFVAIKVPHAHTLEFDESRERFFNEAKNAAKLEHPNICRIYDVKDERGRPFIVMEYIDGPNLAEWVNEEDRPRNANDCAGVVARLARAVHFAHERKIIHRDIKPQNILVRRESGQPVLTDFGLAKNLVPGGPDLTHTLQILGTPAYMAPEQTAGAKQAGPLSDVYALGAVLYFLLCQEPPFKFAKDDDILTRLNIVKSEEPAALRDKVANIPRVLEGICNKAMAKEAANRFPTAKDMADTLEKFCRPARNTTRRFLKVVAFVGAALLLLYLSVVLFNLATQKRYPEEKTIGDQQKVIINSGGVKFMGLSKNDDLLLAVGMDRTIRLWDLNTRRALGTWKTPIADTDFLSVSLSPDGWSAFVIVGKDLQKTYLRKINLKTGKYEEVKGNGLKQPFCVQYRPPHGREILVGGNISAGSAQGPFYSVDAKDLTKGYQVGKDKALLAQAQQIVFSSDGKSFLSSIANGGVYLWNALLGDIHCKVPDGDRGFGRVIALSPDAKWALTSCRESTAHLWNLESPEQNKLAIKKATLKGHESVITTMAFSPDGKYAATGGADWMVRVWEVKSAKQIALFSATEHVTCVLFADNGKTILLSDSPGEILSWNWQTALEKNKEKPNPPISYLPGQKNVFSLSVSKDGHRLLSLGSYSLRLWDLKTGKLLKEHKVKESISSRMTNAALSPVGDSAFVLTPVRTKFGDILSIWKWDCETAKLTGPLFDTSKPVSALCYLPSGKEILLGYTPKGPIARLNATTFAHLGILGKDATGATIENLLVSADGSRVLATIPASAYIWDTHSGKLLWKKMSNPIAALSPKGKNALLIRDPNEAQIWDVTTDKQIGTLAGHSDRITTLAYSPDGRLAASGSIDKTVRVWDARSGEQLQVFKGHQRGINAVLFLPDGKRIVSCSPDGAIRFWKLPEGVDIAKNDDVVALPGHKKAVISLSVSKDGRRLLSAGIYDATLRLWDLENGKMLKELTANESRFAGILSASLSPDGNTAFVTAQAQDKPLFLWRWDCETGKLTGPLLDRFTNASAVCYAPTAPEVFVGLMSKGPIARVNAKTLEKIGNIGMGAGGIIPRSLYVSADGSRILSSDDGGAHLWETTAGKLLWKHEIPKKHSPVAALSPNGKKAIFCWISKDAQIWDLEKNKKLKDLIGHQENILSLAFSPDGRYAASGSVDKTVRVWDVKTGKQVHVFKDHKDTMSCVLFLPDGERIVMGSNDGAIRLWKLPEKIALEKNENKVAILDVDFATVTPPYLPKGWQADANVTVKSKTLTVPPATRKEANVTTPKFSIDGDWHLQIVHEIAGNGLLHVTLLADRKTPIDLAVHRGRVEAGKLQREKTKLLGKRSISIRREGNRITITLQGAKPMYLDAKKFGKLSQIRFGLANAGSGGGDVAVHSVKLQGP